MTLFGKLVDMFQVLIVKTVTPVSWVRDGNACHIAGSSFGPTNEKDRIARTRRQSNQPHSDRHPFQGHTGHMDSSNDTQDLSDRRHNERHSDGPSSRRHMYMHYFLITFEEQIK